MTAPIADLVYVTVAAGTVGTAEHVVPTGSPVCGDCAERERVEVEPDSAGVFDNPTSCAYCLRLL